MSKVLYTPIDINFEMPAEADILDWFETHKLTDTTYSEYVNNRHIYCAVAIRGKPKDWYKFDMWWTHWFENRNIVEGAELYFHPGFEERFPGLVSLIKQQPFEQIGGVAIIQQIGPIPVHRDTFDHHMPVEPRRYMTYLSDPKYNTFFLTNKDTGEKRFPTIDDQYRCFAFNNDDIFHGADWHGRPKLLLTTTGIIDHRKHEELLNRSIEKFKDKVIYEF